VVVNRLELVRQWVNARDGEGKVWIILVSERQARGLNTEAESRRVAVEWLALGCRIEELELVETPVDVGQGPSGPSEPSERFCDSHFNTDGRADDRSNTQDRPSDRPSVSNPLKQKVKDGPDDVDERILTLTGDAHGTDLAEAEI
jgi:hypothetical protein